MNWFRWHHGTANDVKLRRVAEAAQTSVANVIGIWAMMLESASENPERGTLGSWDVDDVAFVLGIPVTCVTCVTETMQGKLLDGQRLTGWNKRQPIREDDSYERVQRYRERETMRNAKKRTVTKETPQIRGEEKRVEKKRRTTKATTAASAGSAPSAPNGASDAIPDIDLATITTNLFPAVLGDDWKELTGGVPNYGKLAGQLKSVVQTYGLERVRPAWRKFCGAEQRKYGPAYFAEHFGDYETRYLSGYDEAAVMAACGIKV